MSSARYIGALLLNAFEFINACLAVLICVGGFLGMVVEPREEGGDTARVVKRRGPLGNEVYGKRL